MLQFIRTNSENENFRTLVKELDAELLVRDGEDSAFYSQFNKIDAIRYCMVALDDGVPVGCGAIKQYDSVTMEVKRMYVQPEQRGKGIAFSILKELEQWTSELNYQRCILETGKKQPEAIALYTKSGYKIIPNYGQYENVENSVCFEKIL